jgi:hypothetical protein
MQLRFDSPFDTVKKWMMSRNARLLTAAEKGDYTEIKRLVAKGADINTTNHLASPYLRWLESVLTIFCAG